MQSQDEGERPALHSRGLVVDDIGCPSSVPLSQQPLPGSVKGEKGGGSWGRPQGH